MKAAIYDIANGVIRQYSFGAESSIQKQLLSGESYLAACPDKCTHVIDGVGIYVEPPPPPEPDPPPPPTLSEAIAAKLKELALYRFQKETGGISVSGVGILTDRESQATMSGAYISVQINPLRLIKWKCSDGTWTQIDKATVEFMAGAVADHVEDCFNNEALHSLVIQALSTVEAAQTYDITTGWPT